MPPQRTFPPVKPVKTERTHEENQERAYIAASRRSDRSLEARVESARRASEIHKRRTGRSLRVTEQDVINEEMYEEEDDGLPSQYRMLTAHLQTNSPEFERRLASWVSNHVALRSAMNDAISGNFNQLYPNAPQFAHNSMFPSPFINPNYPQQQQHLQSPTAASPQSPHPYRHVPYPMPGQQHYRPTQQQQLQQQQTPTQIQLPSQPFQLPGDSMTPAIRTPGAQMTVQQPQPQHPLRRASVPVLKRTASYQSASHIPSPKSDTSPRGGSPLVDGLVSKPGSAPASVANGPVSHMQLASQPLQSHPLQPQQHQQRQPRPGKIPNFPSNNNLTPFTMALPPDAQAIVNPAALPNNDFGAALMGNSDWSSFDSAAFGASDPGSMFKSTENFYPNMMGMNSTLAPEQMTKVNGSTFDMGTHLMAGVDGTNTPNFGMGDFFSFDGIAGSNGPSAAGTPLDMGNNVSFDKLFDGTGSNWMNEAT